MKFCNFWNLFFIVIFFIVGSKYSFAQNYTLKSAQDSSLIPYAQIIVFPSQKVVLSEYNGVFNISNLGKIDSIKIMQSGFKTLTLTKPKSSVIYLSPDLYKLDEVKIIVKKGRVKRDRKVDPAYLLHQKIAENKKNNNYASINYQSNIYSKTKVDINNINEKTKELLVFKPIAFIFDNLDSNRAKKSAPIFISESFAKFYYSAEDERKKEEIMDTKVSGISLPSFKQFTGNAYFSFNLYDNYYNILQKSFVSPMGDLSWLSYSYHLTDSVKKNDTTYYQLSFVPLREAELNFTGFMWVNNKNYALSHIHLKINKTTNINYMNELEMDFYFEKNGNYFIPSKEIIFMDVSFQNDLYGMYILKENYYSGSQIVDKMPKEYYDLRERVNVNENSNNLNGSLIAKIRPDSLSTDEKNRYVLVDSAVNTKYITFIRKFSEMYITGYYPTKYLEPGPYYTFYSFNNIEGNRFRFGGTTTPNLLKKIQLMGYVAYGFGDERWKHKSMVKYFYDKKYWRYAELNYEDRYGILSISENAFQEDNILASLSRRSNPRFTHQKKFKAIIFHDWINGINNYISVNLHQYRPLGELNYITPKNTSLDIIHNNFISIGGRFAKDEKFMYYGFRRFSLQTRKPQINYQYSRGFKMNDLGYNYDKISLSFFDRYYLGYIGFIDITVFADKIWGNLPYPLLINHPGNDSYYYDNKAFNMMLPFEFVSDQSVSVFVTHNFNGMFVNYLPLIKKLKLRELIFAKGVYGTLSPQHQNLVVLPKGLSALNQPYVEVGVGIENILKMLRVDFVWRLSNLNPDVANFGINFALKFRP